ncbi:MAG: UbiH/UbiF/VisC/COQ6 family ubiquinone biosynthesis hydroxylase [Candidatus Obscuribacterales bacterium]|nr:UbiH/UbiF/VisC/COQ6 family ubiquinone biosynthesis hydroxylase [Steroidobacteraceae bacterium]
MTTDFDILIVGGGMVGACVAALAATEPSLQDARIALLEPHAPTMPPPNHDVDLRVSAISRASERILRCAQAWSHIPAIHRSAYDCMTVWDAVNKLDDAATLHFSAAETSEANLGYIIENRRLQWALFEAQPLRQRVTILGAPLRDLQFVEHGAHVTLADERKLRVSLVIGADGANSTSRKMAGITTSGWQYEQSAVVTHVKTEKSHQRTAWQRFTPSGPVAFLPLADGRSSIVWTNPTDQAERLINLNAEDFAAELERASDCVLGKINVDVPRAHFPLQLAHARDYTRARFALVGDAAHAVHPLAGQGVNLGFLDAAALIETLADARAEGAEFSALGEPRVLRRYERWRKSENLLAMGLIDGINRLFSNHSTVLGALRRVGFRAIEHTPIAKRFFILRALGLAGERPKMVA